MTALSGSSFVISDAIRLLTADHSKQTAPKGLSSSPWLTVKEAAGYSSLSADTIYTACERGELRHARVSGRRTIRLRTKWIDAWLERHIRG